MPLGDIGRFGNRRGQSLTRRFQGPRRAGLVSLGEGDATAQEAKRRRGARQVRDFGQRRFIEDLARFLEIAREHGRVPAGCGHASIRIDPGGKSRQSFLERSRVAFPPEIDVSGLDGRDDGIGRDL